MKELTIKFVPDAGEPWCGECGERVIAERGPQLFVDEEPVCRDCGKKHATARGGARGSGPRGRARRQGVPARAGAADGGAVGPGPRRRGLQSPHAAAAQESGMNLLTLPGRRRSPGSAVFSILAPELLRGSGASSFSHAACGLATAAKPQAAAEINLPGEARLIARHRRIHAEGPRIDAAGQRQHVRKAGLFENRRRRQTAHAVMAVRGRSSRPPKA